MDRPLSVLLIEDEPLECQEMIRCMEPIKEIHLVGVTNNAVKALEYVRDSLPDAIILDLELHKGYGNGLMFLDSLKEMRLNLPIYILVTTNNISHITHDGARKMGADFIMVKTQDDYSAKGVIDFLLSLKNVIQGNRKSTARFDIEEPPEQKRQRVINRIITELDRIGVPPGAVGRKYLIDSIMLIINGQTDKLYITIGEKYAKTEGSVERAMFLAIEKAWKTASFEDLEKYYTARIYSERGMPTIKEFIHYYAEKVENEYRLRGI